MKFVISGRPGVGKSTLFNLIVEALKKRGYVVGGFIAPEVREGGIRQGFKLVDLLTGEETWLARRGYPSSTRVGSYGVLVETADKLASRALLRALEVADVIAIDEVGPMELKLPSFKQNLLRALDSGKPMLLVVHHRLEDSEIMSRLGNAVKIFVSIENREELRNKTPGEVVTALERFRRVLKS